MEMAILRRERVEVAVFTVAQVYPVTSAYRFNGIQFALIEHPVQILDRDDMMGHPNNVIYTCGVEAVENTHFRKHLLDPLVLLCRIENPPNRSICVCVPRMIIHHFRGETDELSSQNSNATDCGFISR